MHIIIKFKNKIALVLLAVVFCVCGCFLADKGEPYEKEEFDDLQPLCKGAENGFDINSASKEDFMTVKGIGEVYAQNIITARDEMGGFRDMRDLLYADGIGMKRMEDISQHGKIN